MYPSFQQRQRRWNTMPCYDQLASNGGILEVDRKVRRMLKCKKSRSPVSQNPMEKRCLLDSKTLGVQEVNMLAVLFKMAVPISNTGRLHVFGTV